MVGMVWGPDVQPRTRKKISAPAITANTIHPLVVFRDGGADAEDVKAHNTTLINQCNPEPTQQPIKQSRRNPHQLIASFLVPTPSPNFRHNAMQIPTTPPPTMNSPPLQLPSISGNLNSPNPIPELYLAPLKSLVMLFNQVSKAAHS
jgi:hypothetical protein